MKKRNKSRWFYGFLLGLILALFPSVAEANAGVPMIFLVYPPLTIAIIPIIFIEAVVYTKLLNLSRKEALIGSFCANFISTIVGFPLLWMAIVFVAYVVYFLNLSQVANFILFSAWVGSAPNEQLLFLVPLSAFLFLIIAFFVSVFVKNFLMKCLLLRVWHKLIEIERVQKAVDIANLATYIPLVIFIPLFLRFKMGG